MRGGRGAGEAGHVPERRREILEVALVQRERREADERADLRGQLLDGVGGQLEQAEAVPGSEERGAVDGGDLEKEGKG